MNEQWLIPHATKEKLQQRFTWNERPLISNATGKKKWKSTSPMWQGKNTDILKLQQAEPWEPVQPAEPAEPDEQHNLQNQQNQQNLEKTLNWQWLVSHVTKKNNHCTATEIYLKQKTTDLPYHRKKQKYLPCDNTMMYLNTNKQNFQKLLKRAKGTSTIFKTSKILKSHEPAEVTPSCDKKCFWSKRPLYCNRETCYKRPLIFHTTGRNTWNNDHCTC